MAARLVYNGTTSNFQYIIDNGSGGSSGGNVKIVATIADRDAIVRPSGLVWVIDATADPTVDRGGAIYGWETTSSKWIKLAEEESLDIALNLNWSDITGRPSASPANIDDAVIKKHEHANKAALDSITTASVHTHPNKTLLDSITADNGYYHKHSNLAALETFTAEEIARLRGITANQILNFHKHVNMSALNRLGISANSELTIDGIPIQAGGASAGIRYASYEFTKTAELDEYKFNLEALKLKKGMEVSIWERTADGTEYTEPDHLYSDTELIVDMTGFTAGTYVLTYMVIDEDNTSAQLGEKPFTLSSGQSSVTFTQEQLGVTGKIDPSVWQVLNGEEHAVKADVSYDNSSVLTLGLSKFPTGNYILRYIKIVS